MNQVKATNYTAVVCAAGQGKRLAPLTDALPKTLITVGKKSILEHLLDSFSLCGLTDVVIVVGYKGDMIERKIGKRYKQCRITYVYNPEHEITDNFYTMYLAKDKVGGAMIFFNADIIFNKDILDTVITDGHENSVAAVSVDSPGAGRNPVRVKFDQLGRLLDIGHDIGEENNKMVFGIYKLSRAAAKRYFTLAEEFFKTGPRQAGFWLPIKQLAYEMSLNVSFVGNEKWVSINTREEYDNAVRLVDSILSE